METKTLKDLCRFGTSISNVSGVGQIDEKSYELVLVKFSDLKQEAINHIRHILSFEKITEFDKGSINILKIFFNLSEEEIYLGHKMTYYLCHKCNKQIDEEFMGKKCPHCSEWLYYQKSKKECFVEFK